MRLVFLLGLLLGCACAPAQCQEDVRAQTGLAQILLELPGEDLTAERASTMTQLERGWKHRRCEREGLWLDPEDEAASLDIWGCGLVDPLSVYFVRDGVVLEVVESLDPCPEPCNSCGFVVAPEGTTQVLETLVGRVELEPGDALSQIEPVPSEAPRVPSTFRAELQ